jgi:hypothetical protein
MIACKAAQARPAGRPNPRQIYRAIFSSHELDRRVMAWVLPSAKCRALAVHALERRDFPGEARSSTAIDRARSSPLIRFEKAIAS